MEHLGITQQYVLLALGAKPSEKTFHNAERGVSLFAASIMELLRAGVLTQDEKKRLAVAGELPPALSYLEPLYGHMEELKPQKAQDVARKYIATFLNRRLDELSGAVIDSLKEQGVLLEQDEDGLFGPVSRLSPKPEAVEEIVAAVRDAFLHQDAPQEQAMILAILLRHGKLLKRYFSPYEMQTIKQQLKAQKKNPANQMVRAIQEQLDMMMVAMISVTSSR